MTCAKAPALHIVETLARAKIGELLVVEPNIRELPATLISFKCLRRANLREALTAADVIVLLVDHRQFKRIDRELLNLKIIIDTRGIWR